MKVPLIRDVMTDEITLGTIVFPDQIFQTLELPWKENQHQISCIPEGEYPCIFEHNHPKFGDIYRILNVPNRDGILIHCGNIVQDTHGCVLLGLKRDYFPEKNVCSIYNSRSAKERFIKLVGNEFTLIISKK
jgi:hypothetical protein